MEINLPQLPNALGENEDSSANGRSFSRKISLILGLKC